MSYTYDPTNDNGRVRLLIPDRVEADAVYSDEEIAAFLALESGVYRAAALAVETIASDTAMTLRYTQTVGLTVDGTKASAELLKRAERLRTQADAADAAAEAAAEGGAFDWAEMVVDPFSYRERVVAERLRGSP